MPDKMYSKELQDELPLILEAIRSRKVTPAPLGQVQGGEGMVRMPQVAGPAVDQHGNETVGPDFPPYQMLGEPQTQEQLGRAIVRQAQEERGREQEAMGRAIVRMSQEPLPKAKRK